MTKVLLAAIALGLWINAVQIWQPAKARSGLEVDTSSMALALTRLSEIATGTCRNQKLCGGH
jgi:hypothetical protein